ncbi:phosphatases II [Lojkania enalia]|uniref:Phosphatases II n=1 Tax=Lojkania enalia TaxID=147567 RepID=A0A9P4JWD2_9PLEO|nr:phosphatases II [Didymosphaeria enalia]
MLTAHEDTAMSDVSRSHRRHHEYTYRLPTPPRIVVPPPTLTAEMPELNVSSGRENFEEDLDTSFLKELNLESIIQKNTLMEWAYERRRQAQMILPWLYLGPLTAAKDQAFLTREGITMILAVRSRGSSMSRALQIGREICGEIGAIEASDYFTLIGNFSRATRMINQHIAKVRKATSTTDNPRLGKVLVFCESGNEKSAAVVAAYLMEMMDNFDHIKAMQVCQAQRFCVNFDDTIKNTLRSHWDILTARRGVAISASQQQTQPASSLKPKRLIDETMSDDEFGMDDSLDPSDVLRFNGRANTPFQDTA